MTLNVITKSCVPNKIELEFVSTVDDPIYDDFSLFLDKERAMFLANALIKQVELLDQIRGIDEI